MHTRVVDRNTAHRKIAQFLGYFHLVHEHNQGESCMLLVAPNILGLRFILADLYCRSHMLEISKQYFDGALCITVFVLF